MVPALLEALKDEHQVHENVVVALHRIGSAAVPRLLPALSDKDPRVRLDVLATLRYMPREASPALPALVRLLEDRDPRIRAQAVQMLGLIGGRTVLPLFTVRLRDDPNLEVRRHAAFALAGYGPEAREAIPILLQVLREIETGSLMRTLGASTVGWMSSLSGQGPVLAIVALVRGIGEDSCPWCPWGSRAADYYYVKRAKYLGIAVCEALRQMGETALPALLELARDPDRGLRGHAIGLLGELGPKAKAAVPLLMDLLGDSDEELRTEVTYALGAIGSEAKSALPALTRALKKGSGEVRMHTAVALGRIDQGNRDALDTLIAAVQDKEDELRRQSVVNGLGLLGAGAKPAIPVLLAALKDKNRDLPYCALLNLEKIGVHAKPAVLPGILQALRDEEADIRRAAAWALIEIQDRGAAVPALIVALQDRSDDVRLHAACALAAHGKEAQPALEALRTAAHDPSDAVRKAATRAIEKIQSASER